MTPEVRSLAEFLDAAESIVVLSGAGVSTGSGIPDYRDRNGDWKHAQPIQFGDFVRKPSARQRYWSRSYTGWPRFSQAVPNDAHAALTRLESAGKVDTLITQNVDELHARAGSRNVIDLHGRLSKVRCLKCDTVTERARMQEALEAANPDWHAEATEIRADGDAELPNDSGAQFAVPDCEACGGMLKPDVVMFGESVPRARVQEAMAAVERADGLLVTGSSLMVFSGFRFARHAAAAETPIAIVNRGRTRADELASLKIDADCLHVLPAAVRAIAR
ncbi:MAG: NAD-dependent protein deacetylase [Woeseiaceae bacterium]